MSPQLTPDNFRADLDDDDLARLRVIGIDHGLSDLGEVSVDELDYLLRGSRLYYRPQDRAMLDRLAGRGLMIRRSDIRVSADRPTWAWRTEEGPPAPGCDRSALALYRLTALGRALLEQLLKRAL